MAEGRPTLPVLLREIQVKILHLMPLNEWPLVNDVLPLVLESNCMRRSLNLDRIDDIESELVLLLLNHADIVKRLTWNCATWDSDINSSLVLQNLISLEHLDIAFN